MAMGFFDSISLKQLKDGLTRTRDGIFGRVARLVTTKSTIDTETLAELEEILIEADVGVDAATAIVESIQQHVRENRYATVGELNSLLREGVERQLARIGTGDSTEQAPARDGQKPRVIMVVGVNGAGKTTTIGKLAFSYGREGKKVMIAAGDTFRAAANEQIEIWARRVGAEVLQQNPGADPAAVAFDALNAARAREVDILLIDTAGRLHTRVNLMEELKKVKRVVQKIDPAAPHEVLLVLDATTGQNGLNQARQFGKAVDVTGIVLTKLDGTAKGGIVIAITRELDIPVRYIGVGEGVDDLQRFDGKQFVEALFSRDQSN